MKYLFAIIMLIINIVFSFILLIPYFLFYCISNGSFKSLQDWGNVYLNDIIETLDNYIENFIK